MSVETPQHAVSLLIQGIQLAQKRGAFQLEEASVLSSAVNFLTGGVETNELSANAGEKILRNRRKKLYEIIKRAAAQKVEVVPILLERMQDKAIAASSSSISSSSNSEHPNLGSRLNKAHRIGRLKISDVLSVSEERIVKHR